jgi:hypothetical protein
MCSLHDFQTGKHRVEKSVVEACEQWRVVYIPASTRGQYFRPSSHTRTWAPPPTFTSRVGRTDRILLPPSIKNKNNKISPTWV